jgi:U3 small nucleolar RNA-associated protein 18
MCSVGKKAAVWEDPEDAKLEVNITSQARQRKLHKEKGETTINGVEYEKRLREQHR